MCSFVCSFFELYLYLYLVYVYVFICMQFL